jgi:hypothetical protein
MNWFKWISCWYNKKHILVSYRNKEGTPFHKCIRCGIEYHVDAKDS